MSEKTEVEEALKRADRGIYHNNPGIVEAQLAIADRRLLSAEVRSLRQDIKNLEVTMRGMFTELQELRAAPTIVEFQDEGYGEFSVGYSDGHVEVRSTS